MMRTIFFVNTGFTDASMNTKERCAFKQRNVDGHVLILDGRIPDKIL